MSEDPPPTAELPFRTAGEWAAYLRWRDLLAEDAGVGGWAQEVVGGPIDKLEATLFGAGGVSLADLAVVAALGRLGQLSRRTLPPARALSTYRRLGHAVESLEAIRALPLEVIERASAEVSASTLGRAGVGGALAGALGAVGMIAGVGPLLFASLHAVHRIALLHGHDLTLPEEEHFAVLVLAASLVSRPSLHAQVLHHLEAVAHALEVAPGEGGEGQAAAKITENVAEALTLQLVLGLMTRSWPLAGLVVGAGYTRAFVARAVRTARAAYGQRALLRRHGDAACAATAD